MPVPPTRHELAEIARVSHGQAFTAQDAKGLDAIYTRLGAELGHKKVKHEITASFAGGGLVLLLLGSVAVACLVRTAYLSTELTKENR